MRKLFLFSFVLVVVTGCMAGNPALGGRHLSLVSNHKLNETGHVLANEATVEYGGIYAEKPKLTKYLKDRVAEIVAISETPDDPFEVRLLDSGTFNAFAVPGHTIMLRGALPFFNNEAEMMTVLAHEVGHVTARHMARTATAGVFANIAVVGAQIAVASQGGGQAAMDLVGQTSVLAASAAMSGYGRKHELEADMLGVRYISKLCYDPAAAVNMFNTMENLSKHQDKILAALGVPTQTTAFARLFHSHPENEQRIAEAAKESENSATCGNMWHRDRYLSMIDGIRFGGNMSEGFGADGVFYHPEKRFTFNVPKPYFFPDILGYTAANPINKAWVGFKVVSAEGDMGVEEVLLKEIPNLRGLEPTFINGSAAYTGTSPGIGSTDNGKMFRIVMIPAMEANGKPRKTDMVMLVFAAPEAAFNDADAEFLKIAQTFRHLDTKQADKIKPMRLKIHTVRSGESVASLAANLPFQKFQEDWLRLLNGMRETDEVKAGQKLKVVHNPNKGLKF